MRLLPVPHRVRLPLRSRELIRTGAIVFWAGLVAASWIWLFEYQFTSYGRPGASELRWPAASSFQPDPERPTLLVFVHPKCPCTRATITELKRLLGSPGSRAIACRPRVLVIVYRPDDAPEDWHDTSLVRRAATIPLSTIHLDANGNEATRFRATTSGTVMLFGPDRNLRFAGGVTVSRGQEGFSPGLAALEKHLCADGLPLTVDIPVYGCLLRHPELCDSAGDVCNQQCHGPQSQPGPDSAASE